MVYVLADCEDGFPACDGVGADHGVNGGKFFADVIGGASGGGVEFEVIVFGARVELGLRISGGQGVEKFLVRSRKTVVQLIAGSPEGI